jgi:hypothetical protein
MIFGFTFLSWNCTASSWWMLACILVGIFFVAACSRKPETSIPMVCGALPRRRYDGFADCKTK